MSLSDLEKEILAAAEKINLGGLCRSLEARKEHFLAEIAKIDAELEKLLGKKKESTPAESPRKAPRTAGKDADVDKA